MIACEMRRHEPEGNPNDQNRVSEQRYQSGSFDCSGNHQSGENDVTANFEVDRPKRPIHLRRWIVLEYARKRVMDPARGVEEVAKESCVSKITARRQRRSQRASRQRRA